MKFARMIFFAIAAFFLLAGAPLVFFLQWRTERLESLAAGSQTIGTPLGLVEFAEISGEKMPVLVLHAGAGGYDQGLLMADALAAAGHRVISLSRPGYLRTPIASGIFPEQQADLAAVLLRMLGVESAGILAAAEASPAAIHLALRHPELVRRVCLLSPLVQRPSAPAEGRFSLPAEALLYFVGGDLESWMLAPGLHWRTRQTIEDILGLETNLKQYPAYQLASQLATEPSAVADFGQFFHTLTPISPREIGTRNDIVQMRGLPGLPLADFKSPLLVLRGENDALADEKNIQALRQSVPHINEVVIPGAGFLLPGFGVPATVAGEAMQSFFKE